jgi:hypothetical protein
MKMERAAARKRKMEEERREKSEVRIYLSHSFSFERSNPQNPKRGFGCWCRCCS